MNAGHREKHQNKAKLQNCTALRWNSTGVARSATATSSSRRVTKTISTGRLTPRQVVATPPISVAEPPPFSPASTCRATGFEPFPLPNSATELTLTTQKPDAVKS